MSVAHVYSSWLRYNFAAGRFQTMKLCSRLLMLFSRNFYENRQISVSEPNLGEVRGDARPWLMARWKANGRLSIRIYWTFFAINYGSRVTRLNVYSSAVFTGVDLFAVKFYLRRIVQKTRDPGLPEVKTLSFCVASFWHNTGVWRTDRQTDERICRNI